MSIVFDWLNPNQSELTKIEVYRAEKRGGDKTLLATVAPTALAYEDTAADVNRVYWYSTIAYIGDDKTASVENPLASFEKTGPGGQKLLRGDWGLGYFGEVALGELPSFSDIGTKTGFGTASASTVANKKLHKFIANGKIIFIPGCPLTTSVFTVNQLRAQKVLPQIDQPDKELLRMTKGDFSYFIRPPFMDDRGSKAADGSLAFTSNRLTSYPDSFFTSEFAALLSIFWNSNQYYPAQSYFPFLPQMSDNELLDISYFNNYAHTATAVINGADTTNFLCIFRAYDLSVATISNGGARAFWPIYVLDMEG